MNSEFYARLLYKSLLKLNEGMCMDLIMHGVDPNYLLPEGMTPFHICVGIDDVDMSTRLARILLKIGADPNIRSPDDCTPLHIACALGRCDVVHLLLQNNADPFLRDQDEMDALDNAVESGCKICIGLVQQRMTQIKDARSKPSDTTYTIETSVWSDQQESKFEAESKMSQLLRPQSSLSSGSFRTCNDEESLATKPNDNAYSSLDSFMMKEKLCEEASTFEMTEGLSGLKLEDSGGSLRSYEFSRDLLNEALAYSSDATVDSSLNSNPKDRQSNYVVNDKDYTSKEALLDLSLYTSDNSVHSNIDKDADCKGDGRDAMRSHSSLNKVLSEKVKNWLGFNLSSSKASSAETESVASKESVQTKASKCSCQSQHTVVSVHTDAENGFQVVETRFVPDNGNLDASHQSCASSCVSIGSTLKDWKESEACKKDSNAPVTEPTESAVPLNVSSLDNRALRQELEQLGDNPGPITISTRKIYEHRLHRLRTNLGTASLSSLPSSEGDVFHAEVHQYLSGVLDLSSQSMDNLEQKMIDPFEDPDPNRHWREGTSKSCFTYLLLDPRVTQNLPNRVKSMSEKEAFNIFLKSVFYVGKGSRSRPYAHFKEAIQHMKKTNSTSTKPISTKVAQIAEIWQEKLGVVTLHIFQNVIPVEAYTREACMIEALGLQRVTNKCHGQLYGPAANFTRHNIRRIGLRLLKKAFKILIFEGERHIRPHDLKI